MWQSQVTWQSQATAVTQNCHRPQKVGICHPKLKRKNKRDKKGRAFGWAGTHCCRRWGWKWEEEGLWCSCRAHREGRLGSRAGRRWGRTRRCCAAAPRALKDRQHWGSATEPAQILYQTEDESSPAKDGAAQTHVPIAPGSWTGAAGIIPLITTNDTEVFKAFPAPNEAQLAEFSSCFLCLGSSPCLPQQFQLCIV